MPSFPSWGSRSKPADSTEGATELHGAGSDSAEEYRRLPVQPADGKTKQLEKVLRRMLNTAVSTQSEPAQAYVRKLRERKPAATPAEIRTTIDNHFLTAVSAAGTAAGATATVPGIGTLAAFGAVTADAAAFLEAVTFHTLATAIVQGVDIRSQDQREILVSIVILGSTGNAIIDRATKGKKGSAARRATQVPDAGKINNMLMSRMARKFFLSRLKGAWKKFLPVGIGAVLGGWGNHKAGRALLNQSKEVFGPPPAEFPRTPELGAGS